MNQDPVTATRDQKEQAPRRAAANVPVRKSQPIPWLPLILLVLGIYLFWVLPVQREPGRVEVEFSEATKE